MMEATGTAEARWPTDIVEAREAAMLARLGDVEDALTPLRAEVKDARHPWWWVMMAIIVGGAGLAFSIWDRLGPGTWLIVILTVAGAVWAYRKAAGFQEILDEARGELDAKLLGDVLHVTAKAADREALRPYEEAGFLGHWEDIQRLERYACEDRDLLFAHLTREETTTDSEGKTERRTVTVFRGLLFELPFPEAEGDALTVLRRGGSANPRGRFERRDPAGRRIKLEPIKTSSLEFNKRHRIATTDKVIGHAILDPDRVMRFIQMEHDLSDTIKWGRAAYAMVFTQGRAWVQVGGVDVPRPAKFPEGAALAKQLRKVFQPLSLPAVMAHHLRLPPENGEEPR